MTVGEILKLYPTIELDFLLAYALNKNREFLFAHPELKLTTKQFNNLKRLMQKRQRGVPIAYLLGYKDFYGLRFKVNPDVLIPRPESEWLVERALRLVKNQRLRIKDILDLGTGSGCLAITLATLIHSRIAVKLCAADVSKKALTVAKNNAKTILAKSYHAPVHDNFYRKTKINFVQSDLFSNLPKKFDLILANLPYVSESDYKLLTENLKYEPKRALVAKNNWQIYKRFFYQVSPHLNPGALILLEINPKSKNLIERWARRNLPQATIKLSKDLRGLWRYCEIRGK